MDQLKQYQEVIEQLLANHAALINRTATGEAHTIFDTQSSRYMLFRVGWNGKERITVPVLYLHVTEGKIWIETDWTEEGIASDLLRANIPSDKIVLGFRHPNIRPYSEFAVA